MNTSNTPNFLARAWFAFLIVACFFLYEFVARISPSLASDDIKVWFDINNAQFGTLSSLFFWIYAPMQLVVGLLLDKYGPRRFVLPAILILAVGVGLFSFSNNVILGGIGRFLCGLGASFAFVSGLYVVSHYFAPSRFALLSGAFNALGMLGTAIGAVWLTSVMAQADWRSVFYATSAAGFVLFALALFGFRDPKVEAQKPQALLQPLKTIAADGRIWWIALLGALFYMPINVFGGLWGQSELSADHGLDPVAAEIAVSMIYWGMAAGSISAGWVSDKFGHRKWILAIHAALATIAYSLAIFTPSESELFIASMLFLGGFFCGGQMLTFAMAKESHAASMSGTAIAFINMIGISGALVFQPLVGYLIDSSQGNFQVAMYTIPGCLIATMLMSMMLKEKRLSEHQ